MTGAPSRRATNADLESRRRAILARVVEAGEIGIDRLADEFTVSLMTMHRDLDELAQRRLLRKLRGRAVSLPTVTMETASRLRADIHTAEKAAIAEAALDQLPAQGTLLMDDSTTLIPLVRRLDKCGHYTVVTNSVGLARIVAETNGSQAILLGGHYDGTYDATTGVEVIRAIQRLHANVAFMSAVAVNEGRLYHPILDFAAIKEVMLEAAERHVLLVDSSKFGRRSTHAHGDVRAYDLVVTDEAAPPAETDAIREWGVPLRCVPVHAHDPSQPTGPLETPAKE